MLRDEAIVGSTAQSKTWLHEFLQKAILGNHRPTTCHQAVTQRGESALLCSSCARNPKPVPLRTAFWLQRY